MSLEHACTALLVVLIFTKTHTHTGYIGYIGYSGYIGYIGYCTTAGCCWVGVAMMFT